MTIFLILFTFLNLSIQTTVTIDDFYETISSNNIEEINKLIQKLEDSNYSTDIAYKATLLMKKSSFEKILKDKIKLFKEGANLLEAQIKLNPKNTELRFLRIIIQENAPKILKYNTNIETDKDILIKSFKHLKSSLQKHILIYSKTSLVLNKTNFIE